MLLYGANLALNWLPWWWALANEYLSRDQKLSDWAETVLAWLVGAFLILALLLSTAAPLSVRRIFGGTILKSKPNLVGFEGIMDIKELEKTVFGNSMGRLTYASSSTPLCIDNRHQRERKGNDTWIDKKDATSGPRPLPGHRLFTLVDLGDLTVSIFSAERPPTVALLAAREGGMLRAVLCSWRFENDCLFKETVMRMPSSVYEAAVTKDWLKLCLTTQDQARVNTYLQPGASDAWEE